MSTKIIKASGLFKSAMVMSIATFCSRILGLVREQSIAYFFGASGLTDTFNVAYRIPNLLRDMLAEGAFSSAFVPTFTQYLQKNVDEARELFRSCFWFLLILSGFITILFYVFSSTMVLFFAPEFAKEPEKLALTVTLLQIMSPFLTLTSLAAVIMGVLNTHKLFFVPALAPASFNLVSISIIWMLTRWLENKGYLGIYSLAWGVLIGGIAQAMVQLPLLYKKGFDLKFPKYIFSPGLRQILRRLAPGLVGYSTSQINILINTILATSSVVGSVSWLNYGFRLFSFPLGILSISLSSSTLVHFSDYWKSNKKDQAIELLGRSYYLAWMLVAVPFLFVILFPDWLVNLIYERGQFNQEDTRQTSLALFWYGLGLPFYGMFKNLMPLFYSIDRSRIPMYAAFVSLSINVVYSITFIDQYGHQVLAQATTLSVFINVCILVYFLNKYLKLSPKFFFANEVLKIWFAVGILIVPCYWLHSSIPFYIMPGLMKILVLFLLAATLYLALDFLLYFLGAEPLFLKRIAKIFKQKNNSPKL